MLVDIVPTESNSAMTSFGERHPMKVAADISRLVTIFLQDIRTSEIFQSLTSLMG